MRTMGVKEKGVGEEGSNQAFLPHQQTDPRNLLGWGGKKGILCGIFLALFAKNIVCKKDLVVFFFSRREKTKRIRKPCQHAASFSVSYF